MREGCGGQIEETHFANRGPTSDDKKDNEKSEKKHRNMGRSGQHCMVVSDTMAPEGQGFACETTQQDQ